MVLVKFANLARSNLLRKFKNLRRKYEKTFHIGNFGINFCRLWRKSEKEYSQKILKACEETKKLFKQSCEKGYEVYCSVIYKLRLGVKQDFAKAFELYQKICKSGTALGCDNLGAMYAEGRGVKKDLNQAMEYYGKACEMRDEKGYENYSRLYDEMKR